MGGGARKKVEVGRLAALPEESFGSAMGWESRSLLLGGKGGGGGWPHSFVTPFFASALSWENPTQIAVAAPPRPDPTKTHSLEPYPR